MVNSLQTTLLSIFVVSDHPIKPDEIFQTPPRSGRKFTQTGKVAQIVSTPRPSLNTSKVIFVLTPTTRLPTRQMYSSPRPSMLELRPGSRSSMFELCVSLRSSTLYPMSSTIDRYSHPRSSRIDLCSSPGLSTFESCSSREGLKRQTSKRVRRLSPILEPCSRVLFIIYR
jgi:hypothetical protein